MKFPTVKFPSLKKMGNVIHFPKSPKVIRIMELSDKSCGTCLHYRIPGFGKGGGDYCMHYPESDLTEVINKVCKPEERKLWTLKRQDGIITRFFQWLF